MGRRRLVAREGKPAGPAWLGLEEHDSNGQRRRQLIGGLSDGGVIEPHDVVGVVVRHFDVDIVRGSDVMGFEMAVRDDGRVMVRVAPMGVGGGQPPPECHDRHDDAARDRALNRPQALIIVARLGLGQCAGAS